MKERVEGLVAQFNDQELDGVLISAPENRRYLSGFSGSAGYLLITKAKAVLVTDSRYTEQATNQSPYFDVRQVRGGWGWLIDELKDSGVKKVGFESQDMTVASYNNLIDAIKGDSALGDVSFVPAPGLAENQRIIKDHEELQMLQLAIDAADKAMDQVTPVITPGMTEKEVAWRLETAMRDFGADTISFDTIVAAGPNGAMAHHQPTDYVIKQNDPIVIDMGAKVAGYCSDLSRSIAVGEPDEFDAGLARFAAGPNRRGHPDDVGERTLGELGGEQIEEMSHGAPSPQAQDHPTLDVLERALGRLTLQCFRWREFHLAPRRCSSPRIRRNVGRGECRY